MNKILTAQELKDEIKFGLGGGYLFIGEEEYMKHHYLAEIRKKVLIEQQSNKDYLADI